MIVASLLFLLAQDGAAAPLAPRAVAEDRLSVCLGRARTDPTTAIVEASTWAGEASGAETSYPQQCLGLAYTMLRRWDAAERAFLVARDAAGETDHFRRAQLATMAGNAALAGERPVDALMSLDRAASDAAAAGDDGLRAMVEVDRARAQVMQGREGEAEATLAAARTLDAQSPLAWLLSATLARRLGKLEDAQGLIETAAALSPGYPEIGLEAGVIAMLAGRQAAAEASWRSVIELDPDSEEAASARDYLAQLADLATEAPAAQ
jgi:tetratricopeptide (TPR) repeat protein